MTKPDLCACLILPDARHVADEGKERPLSSDGATSQRAIRFPITIETSLNHPQRQHGRSLGTCVYIVSSINVNV